MAEDIKFRHTMPVQIRFSDVDQFGHMNNSVYFSLYDLAKTTYIKDVFGSADWSKLAIVVANINANFFMPVFFSDHLVIETAGGHLWKSIIILLPMNPGRPMRRWQRCWISTRATWPINSM